MSRRRLDQEHLSLELAQGALKIVRQMIPKEKRAHSKLRASWAVIDARLFGLECVIAAAITECADPLPQHQRGQDG